MKIIKYIYRGIMILIIILANASCSQGSVTEQYSILTKIEIPATRDPFVNTPLLAVGPGDDGIERYWISSYNSIIGSTGVLVDELGRHKIFNFSAEYPGFYSAVMDGKNILWLCGTLDRVVRLDLLTGVWESFPTGAARRLVFQGMAFDPATKKLFIAGSPYLISFDTISKEATNLGYTPANYMRYSFNGSDGTFGIVMDIPGVSVIRWFPGSNEIIINKLPEIINTTLNNSEAFGLSSAPGISNNAGRYYFPKRGWYDLAQNSFDNTGPSPESEARWLYLREGKALGVRMIGSDQEVVEWELSSGRVRHITLMPDYDSPALASVVPTKAGKIVTVNMYGEFSRYDIATGVNELSVTLPITGVQYVDNLIRVDNKRLLGTPSITQRFWEVNLVTGIGQDSGRAAPGSGQISKLWKLAGKIYMAAYTGSELMEYDPTKPVNFPNNPQVVADPPGGMRPVGATTDGKSIYFSSSSPYGSLGSVLTKYNPLTGSALYSLNTLLDQQIMSLAYDDVTNTILGATTNHADAESFPPASNTTYFVRINAKDFSIEAKSEAPNGAIRNEIIGSLGRGKYLCHSQGAADAFTVGSSTYSDVWFVLDSNNIITPSGSSLITFPSGFVKIISTAKIGVFVMQLGKSIELWDMVNYKRIKVIETDFGGYNFKIDDESIYFIYNDKIEIRNLSI